MANSFAFRYPYIVSTGRYVVMCLKYVINIAFDVSSCREGCICLYATLYLINATNGGFNLIVNLGVSFTRSPITLCQFCIKRCYTSGYCLNSRMRITRKSCYRSLGGIFALRLFLMILKSSRNSVDCSLDISGYILNICLGSIVTFY